MPSPAPGAAQGQPARTPEGSSSSRTVPAGAQRGRGGRPGAVSRAQGLALQTPAEERAGPRAATLTRPTRRAGPGDGRPSQRAGSGGGRQEGAPTTGGSRSSETPLASLQEQRDGTREDAVRRLSPPFRPRQSTRQVVLVTQVQTPKTLRSPTPVQTRGCDANSEAAVTGRTACAWLAGQRGDAETPGCRWQSSQHPPGSTARG